MEYEDILITDPKEIENEAPLNGENYEQQIKHPRSKISMTSDDRTPNASPIRKITIRQSNDSEIAQQTSYEIITKKRRDSRPRHSPTVHLDRYEIPLSQSPHDEALTNGLDPIGIELISSHASMSDDDYGDELGSPKMSREVKNLHRSTNGSKILSEYLLKTNESPRRSRKNKDIPIVDPDEHFEVETGSKASPELNDIEGESDSAALPMEPPEKRRKSISRSRSRIRSVSSNRGRKKSVARQLKDDLLLTSDKEEEMGEDDDEELSEVSFVTNRSIEGRAVNPPPKAGWDSFCFKCHTDTAVLSLACSKCKCSYHRHCVRPNPIPKNVDEFVCPECREIANSEALSSNKYGHEKIDPHTLSEMLMMILEKIRSYPEREQFENDIVVKLTKEPSQPFIITQMSFKILESRIKSFYYKVTEAFVHDLKQLEHNWNIVDRTKSKTLKNIMKIVTTEMNELEACVFCYQKSFIANDWFVHPCKRPHLLIWAKLKGYPYWPAKVMSIDSRQQVDVRFFGAHDRAWVPAAHCLLFSEKDPNKTKGSTPTNNKNASKTQKGIADAMKEKDDYIEHLRAKYGFKYSPFRTQFNALDLQKQLDFMLPGLKSSRENGSEEGTQKESIRLKIIKGASNYQVEHKQDKPKLYKVLSKTDDNADLEQPAKLSLIIKRKSNVDQDVEKPKRIRGNDITASDTSESNLNVPVGKEKLLRRNSTLSAQKHKKMAKETQNKKFKQKSQKNNGGAVVFDEVTVTKMTKRTRARSMLEDAASPMIVPVLTIPPGTNEIQELRETSESPQTQKKTRSQSLQRSRSIDKEPTQEFRRERSRSTSKDVNPSRDLKRTLSINSNSLRRSMSHSEGLTKSLAPAKEPESEFDPNLIIKDEPVSDSEEILERGTLTVRDIPNLMQDNGGKKKLIVISTNENNENSSGSQQKGRARKTFPNNPNQIQIDSLTSQNNRIGDWMVCIPFAEASTSGGLSSNMQSPPASNRSTPHSDSQQRSNVSSSRTTPNLPTRNPQTSSQNLNRRNTNPLNGQTINRTAFQNDNLRRQSTNELPRLLPRPQGVFKNDGSTFSRDVGPVSRMFNDNSHRITEFFRELMVDTVSSFAPELPVAENLMLREENEKIRRDMQVVKTECQQKLHEIKREHQEEIDSLKRTFDDRLKAIQLSHEQEKLRLTTEVRQQCESDKQRAIEITRKETKKTTWCSYCTREARFYCCWNTSYCGPSCQKTHWQVHQKCCTNKNSATDSPTTIKQTNESQTQSSKVNHVRSSGQQVQSTQSDVSIQQQQKNLPSSVTSSSNLSQPNPSMISRSFDLRTLQSIFGDHTVRDSNVASQVVKPIPRNNENINSQVDMIHISSIPTSTNQK